ncbi:biotin carboxylase [Streptomyces tateyamensis]|uniref:Biotin carboxylase n=1 Tax=Streptomyces tateyamensis TaxID=565073 RepID=A0A2V4NET0_9ACTN|nr:ATP-grasp domain-containing protein [Streptomyces tateyamensis]PYC83183.1 biotin carboxylase [Streptomyces tateyamensis]
MSAVREHVVVLHRWRDEYARYADYLDHRAQQVSYVTTELSRASAPEAAAAVAVVSATDRLAEVRAAIAGLADRLGPVRRLVALNEGDLDTAARLREELDLPGQRGADLERFRDKLAMVVAAEAGGVRVPAYADAPDAGAVRAFAAAHGWPVVVKPRRGTASRGVAVLHGPEDLSAAAGLGQEPFLVESFVPEPVLHIDGLWTGERLGPWRASRYVNSCREFGAGVFLGSVELDDPELLSAVEEFTAQVGAALGAGQPWVFHLEAFAGVDGNGAPRLTFLEAGARVGGAEIPFVWREVHGVDLMAAAVDIQLGRTPTAPRIPAGRTAGWLLLPLPVPPPCTVLEAAAAPAGGLGPYAGHLPPPGTAIPAVGGYEHVAGRFRFRGESSHEVEAAILRTAGAVRVRCAATTP